MPHIIYDAYHYAKLKTKIKPPNILILFKKKLMILIMAKSP